MMININNTTQNTIHTILNILKVVVEEDSVDTFFFNSVQQALDGIE